MTCGPSTFCKRSALRNTSSQITPTEASAATCTSTSPVLSRENSSTVASADGPASAGIARGTMNGSAPSVRPSTPSGCGKIMRIEISSRITAPPMRSATSDRCSAVRKWRPKNMKISSSTNAIAHSRITMRGRREMGTGLSTLANSGTLPKGSVTSSSRMKV